MKFYTFPISFVFFSLILFNLGFSQESILKAKFDLSLGYVISEQGDSLLTFRIVNNSSYSLEVFPPDIASSMIVCILPNQEEVESSRTYCGNPDESPAITLRPNEIKLYSYPKKEIKALLSFFNEKFGSNATYQIYWKVYDGNYIEETVYGRNGRSRTDRKPTFLKSNSISIQL